VALKMSEAGLLGKPEVARPWQKWPETFAKT
jgi:hypothetical protein